MNNEDIRYIFLGMVFCVAAGFLLGGMVVMKAEQTLVCRWQYTTWKEVEKCDSAPPWRMKESKEYSYAK